MIGETLRRLRGIYGYSGAEMCKLLSISRSYLSEIEGDKKKPSIDLLQKYSEVFNIKLSSLLRFPEDYELAENSGRGQRFITDLMKKLIDAYGE